jgi:hypothetical protein
MVSATPSRQGGYLVAFKDLDSTDSLTPSTGTQGTNTAASTSSVPASLLLPRTHISRHPPLLGRNGNCRRMVRSLQRKSKAQGSGEDSVIIKLLFAVMGATNQRSWYSGHEALHHKFVLWTAASLHCARLNSPTSTRN